MANIDPCYFITEPKFLDALGINLYAPKVKDVIANPKYPQYASLFTLSQEDIWDRMAEEQQKEPIGKPVEGAPTPFELFLINYHASAEVASLAKEAFQFFTHQDVKIVPESKNIIFLGNLAKIDNIKDICQINSEEKFFYFQNEVRKCIGETPVEPPRLNENPKVAMIKAKARLRDRVKRKKGSQNSISFSTMLTALCCMGIGLNPLNIGEISYISASTIFSMTQDKEKYDTDIRIMTAGFGNSKIKPKYWINNPE